MYEKVDERIGEARRKLGILPIPVLAKAVGCNAETLRVFRKGGCALAADKFLRLEEAMNRLVDGKPIVEEGENA